jgi:hypothetical protein
LDLRSLFLFKTIPLLLRGVDVIGQAHTGTGKTAAFALPILTKIKTNRNGPIQALILVPTRELALQVANEINNIMMIQCYKTRHNLTIHNGRGEIVTYLEYLVGRNSGRYRPSHPSLYRGGPGEKRIHNFGHAAKVAADSIGDTFRHTGLQGGDNVQGVDIDCCTILRISDLDADVADTSLES